MAEWTWSSVAAGWEAGPGRRPLDPAMCRDLLAKYRKHPSALGPAMALRLAEKFSLPAVVIDAPSTGNSSRRPSPAAEISANAFR